MALLGLFRGKLSHTRQLGRRRPWDRRPGHGRPRLPWDGRNVLGSALKTCEATRSARAAEPTHAREWDARGCGAYREEGTRTEGGALAREAEGKRST